MRPAFRPRVKICCIQSVDEAWLAIKYGASVLGLVSEMPSGPGVIPDSTIAEIAANVPPGVSTFLLTSRRDAPSIIAQQRRSGVNAIQIVDRVVSGGLNTLRSALPGISLIQVIHVNGEESIEEAEAVAPYVDGLLLDSGNPELPVKELGGTGRTHDWSISRKIRERVMLPVYLAGGLRASNVGEAIREVKPFGLDVCSGVRTDDKLDPLKLEAFFSRVSAVANTSGAY
jgi:phosphoribosylanthranilate isomerase